MESPPGVQPLTVAPASPFLFGPTLDPLSDDSIEANQEHADTEMAQ
jgi:hypothetical protein